MAEKTMTATFTASPEALEKLFGTGDEYIVKAPWERVRWYFKDGTVKERKQDIRERVTRCRDCTSYRPGGINFKARCAKSIGTFVPEPDGFCAWASRRGSDE